MATTILLRHHDEHTELGATRVRHADGQTMLVFMSPVIAVLSAADYAHKADFLHEVIDQLVN